ncbi:DEAD/DEAH box helicase family protein, partial [Staphylococcus epidermidis]
LPLLPTLYPKSIFYQLPPLIHPPTTILITPLISFIKHQLDQLQAIRIQAAYFNTTFTHKQQKHIQHQIKRGPIHFLYLPPHPFQNTFFLNLLPKIQIPLIPFHQPHSISKSPHDF